MCKCFIIEKNYNSTKKQAFTITQTQGLLELVTIDFDSSKLYLSVKFTSP